MTPAATVSLVAAGLAVASLMSTPQPREVWEGREITPDGRSRHVRCVLGDELLFEGAASPNFSVYIGPRRVKFYDPKTGLWTSVIGECRVTDALDAATRLVVHDGQRSGITPAGARGATQ